jgi:HTH-type transcriptional regulator, sugar sensing transcriptional regulator
MDDVFVSRLRDVGFSLYEARLYVALLRGGAQNGNEVAKHAKVPSSKVYTALDKLAAEGVVQSVTNGGLTRFAAIRPSELIARLRKRYNAPLDFLAEELPKVIAPEPPEPFLTVSGLNALHAAASAIINAAHSEIHISCWAEDLVEIGEALAAADGRGVRVYGMLYGEADLPAGTWLRHHYVDIVAGRVGGRLLALVADEGEALIARIPREGSAIAVRSRNQVMTLIVQEYLHHDNVLQRAQINIGFEQWDRWWQADPSLRSEILGRALNGTAEEVAQAGSVANGTPAPRPTKGVRKSVGSRPSRPSKSYD